MHHSLSLLQTVVVQFEEINLQLLKMFEKVRDVIMFKKSENFEIHTQSQLLTEATQHSQFFVTMFSATIIIGQRSPLAVFRLPIVMRLSSN